MVVNGLFIEDKDVVSEQLFRTAPVVLGILIFERCKVVCNG